MFISIEKDIMTNFAFPISEINVLETDPIEDVLKKIAHFCNIKKIPSVEVPMF